MLIRLCGHYFDNPGHVDKLISIVGLPDGWFFRTSRFGGRELISPWEPDIELNLPFEVRHLCEPMEVTKVFPAIEKGRDPVVDKFTIIGVKFNFMTQPGQEAWERIERYLEKMTPRDQRIAKPIMVAPDHKSQFSPHAARRTVRGSLEFYKSEVPHVDLRIIPPEAVAHTVTMTASPNASVVIPAATVAKVEPPTSDFKCADCPQVYGKKQALVMHRMKKHPKNKKEPVGV